MDVRALFGTDKEKELHGTWISGATDAEILIAREGNKNYEDCLNKLNMQKLPRTRGGLDVKSELFLDNMKEAASRFITLDLRGNWTETVEVRGDDGKILHDDNGKIITTKEVIVYSPEKMKRMFDDYPDLFTFVMNASRNIENFREDLIKESLGN